MAVCAAEWPSLCTRLSTLAELLLMWSVESLSCKYNAAVSACHVLTCVYVCALESCVKENLFHLGRIKRRCFSACFIFLTDALLHKNLDVNYLHACPNTGEKRCIVAICWEMFWFSWTTDLSSLYYHSFFTVMLYSNLHLSSVIVVMS